MCKVGGYFIGTCYNGNKIFKLLKKKKFNESHIFKKNNKKICEIKKLYENTEFPNNYKSLYSTDIIPNKNLKNFDLFIEKDRIFEINNANDFINYRILKS